MSEFKKTSKQTEAVKLLASMARNIMLYGGSRSGKTFILCFAVVVRAAKENNSRHIILRKNFNHAKRSIWLDTLPKVLNVAFPDLKPKPNKTDFYFTLENGSEIWVGGLDDKERVEKILGNEYSTIYFNECSQIDYASIQLARTRLAQKNNLAKKTYYDMNPPTKSHWSYWLFEKGLDPQSNEPLETPQDYLSMLMNPFDNLDNIDADYVKLLEQMPEKEKNRFLLGLFNDESEGAVYYSFRRDDHVKPVTKTNGSIFVGMDFNVNPMTAVVFQTVNNNFQFFDEVYLENSDTYKMADELKRKGYTGAKVIPDSTGRNRKTSGQSDFDILSKAGFTIENTFNPFVGDRINNTNRLLASGRVIIDPKCKKLINDLEKVVWKDNKPDQSGANKMLTHISDAFGYGLWKLEPFAKPDLKTTMGER
jgi:PBSX family phage terminase large subunit